MTINQQTNFVTEHNEKVARLWTQLQAARGDEKKYEALFDAFMAAQEERAKFEQENKLNYWWQAKEVK